MVVQGGVSDMRRVSKDELALHKSRDDAWSVYNGRVYNITPYLKFHPGGVGELMQRVMDVECRNEVKLEDDKLVYRNLLTFTESTFFSD